MAFHIGTCMQKDLSTLEKKLHRTIGTTMVEYSMIGEGDRILVAVSGGKDSWVLLDVLYAFQKKAPIHFELIAVNIDQGYAGYRQDKIEDFLQEKKIKSRMEYFDIASLLNEKLDQGEVPCSLCARLRRGVLSGVAKKLNCNKIALGHHLDDIIETLLLNQFFSGKISSMAPVLQPEDGSARVIRPLSFVKEKDIITYAQAKGFPIVCCQCPLACGENTHMDHKRRKLKMLLSELEKDIPEIKSSIASSLTNIHPSHLYDKKLWNFITCSRL